MPHAIVTLPGLRRQVELRQLTVSDLAHSAGVTRVTARRAIEGQPISVSAFRRIVEALNHIPVDPVAALALGCDPAELAQITQMSPPSLSAAACDGRSLDKRKVVAPHLPRTARNDPPPHK